MSVKTYIYRSYNVWWQLSDDNVNVILNFDLFSDLSIYSIFYSWRNVYGVRFSIVIIRIEYFGVIYFFIRSMVFLFAIMCVWFFIRNNLSIEEYECMIVFIIFSKENVITMNPEYECFYKSRCSVVFCVLLCRSFSPYVLFCSGHCCIACPSLIYCFW